MSCSVLFGSVQYRRPNGWPIGLKIRTNTHWDYAKKIGGRRTRVRIDVRAARANVCAAPYIQHMRPNGWADRVPIWYKDSLGQWTEDMTVADRECALMRAQTCAQYRISSIGGQTAGPVEPQIGTKTQWAQVMGVGSAQSEWRSRPARERARSAKVEKKKVLNLRQQVLERVISRIRMLSPPL
jgi:hypothetical protein